MTDYGIPPQPGMLPGRSAWKVYGHDTGVKWYEFKTLALMDGRHPEVDHDHYAVMLGVKGIQKALGVAGYKHSVLGKIPETGQYGPRTKWGVQWLQKRDGLVVDGRFGYLSAKALFVPFVKFFCGGVMGGVVIPYRDVCGMMDLESGFDPGAVSTWYKPENGRDRGIAQINEVWHPEITDVQAFDPFVAIPYAAWRLHGGRMQFSEKGPELQRDCSIAQHNSPKAAIEWYRLGYPPSDQIAKYVNLIKKAASTF